jgi:hypothetical protein
MAWIELHQDVCTHRKTIALADVLDLPEYAAVGLVSCLWLWAVDNADTNTGAIPVTARQLARAIRFDGDPQKLAEALISAGFLAVIEGGFTIPNWDRYIGKLLDQRAANAERQRRHREAKKSGHSDLTPPPAEAQEHVTVTSPLRNAATVPNQTKPNRTVTLPGEVEGAGRPAAGAPRDASGGASPTPPSPKTRPSGSGKGTEIVPDFLPPPEAIRSMREELGLNPDEMRAETEKFRDYFLAKSGPDRLKRDWVAAWRGWMRRSGEFAFRASPSAPARAAPRPGRETMAEAVAALDDDYAALAQTYAASQAQKGAASP